MKRAGKDRAWFAPKRYGYGAGLPIAWQGWAVLIGYIAGVLLSLQLLHPIATFAFTLALSVVLGIVTARTTRGGWRWRWGERD